MPIQGICVILIDGYFNDLGSGFQGSQAVMRIQVVSSGSHHSCQLPTPSFSLDADEDGSLSLSRTHDGSYMVVKVSGQVGESFTYSSHIAASAFSTSGAYVV